MQICLSHRHPKIIHECAVCPLCAVIEERELLNKKLVEERIKAYSQAVEIGSLNKEIERLKCQIR